MKSKNSNNNEHKQGAFSEQKISYLTMLQEPIGRLSTSSSVYKGFTATIVTGIATLSYTDIKLIILILSFIPVLSFVAVDIYYLRLERLYRCLYNDVLFGRHKVDFSITLLTDKETRKRANATIWACICSPSIWLFYPAMLFILTVVCFLKWQGGV